MSPGLSLHGYVRRMQTKRHAAKRLIDGWRGRRQRGQSLVEFALVFPIFIVMMMGILEFSFLFNALLSIGHATRDAALIGAEAGNQSSADCAILETIENDVSSPADKSRIERIDIYQSDRNGNVVAGAVNTYTRTGSKTCQMPDGTSLTVPYSETSNGYPPEDRCNVVAGCPDIAPGRQLDTVGVKITYQHSWVTPLSNLLNLTGSGVQLVQSNAMRMEPIL